MLSLILGFAFLALSLVLDTVMITLFWNDTALAAVKRLRHLRSAFELRQEWQNIILYVYAYCLVRSSDNAFQGYVAAQALVELHSQINLPDSSKDAYSVL